MEGEAEGTDRDGCASFGECGGRQVMVKGGGVVTLMGADEWFWARRNGYYIFFVI